MSDQEFGLPPPIDPELDDLLDLARNEVGPGDAARDRIWGAIAAAMPPPAGPPTGPEGGTPAPGAPPAPSSVPVPQVPVSPAATGAASAQATASALVGKVTIGGLYKILGAAAIVAASGATVWVFDGPSSGSAPVSSPPVVAQKTTMTPPPARLDEARASKNPPETGGAGTETRLPPRDGMLRAEHGLLANARLAISAAEIDKALDILRTHETRFPKGRLAENRDALHVRALMAAGQYDSVQTRVELFRNRYPESFLLADIDRELGSLRPSDQTSAGERPSPK